MTPIADLLGTKSTATQLVLTRRRPTDEKADDDSESRPDDLPPSRRLA
jgi:hypothetical protein